MLYLDMVRVLTLLTLSMLLFSCKKESAKDLGIYIDGAIKTGSIPDTVDGRAVSAGAFRVYLSKIRLVTESGDTLSVADYILYDYPADGLSKRIASLSLSGKRISKLLFSVGLYPELNNSNPVTFPAGHPLSLDKDMHWGMLKYRFIVLEGAFDSTATKSGTPNFPFSLHLGTDTLYRELAIPVYGYGGNLGELHIVLDPLGVYQGYGELPLDMRHFYSNHSSPAEIPDAIELMDNFVSRITTREVIDYLPD